MRTKKIRKAFGEESGFSLIELMIAMSILALGMLAAVSMQYSAVRNNTSGNVATQATMLARVKMEQLKNPSDVTTLASGNDQVDPNGQPGGIYSRTWTVGNLGTSARRLTVTVEWTKFGNTRRVILRSNTKGSGV